jgi:hypothetical protein
MIGFLAKFILGTKDIFVQHNGTIILFDHKKNMTAKHNIIMKSRTKTRRPCLVYTV